jgi:Viral BACON domain
VGPVVISVTAGVVVLLAGLFVNGCRISKLLGGGRSSSDGNGVSFAVSPLEIRDSALVGSTAAHVAKIDISGGEWTATADDPWIHVSPTRGNSRATVRVSLDPKTLSPGRHEGTVTVQRQSAGASIAVAVSFFIQQPVLDLSSDGFSYTARTSDAVFYDTVEVSNTGSGPLTWAARVAHGASWIALGATSGTAPGVIPFQVSSAGLTPFGTFRDTIVVEAPGAKNSPGKVGITLKRRRSD